MKKSTLKILAILVLALAAFAVYTMNKARHPITPVADDDKGIFQSEAIIKKVINGQAVILDKI